MSLRAPLLVLFACISPAALAAQDGGDSASTSSAGRTRPNPAEMQLEAPPITSLFGQRERLSLSSEQLAALDSIQQRWSRENERLSGWGTMVTGGMTPGVSRVRAAPRTPEARLNNYRAAREAGEVLSEAQRATVCTLYRRSQAGAYWPWCRS
jgi:hypothetical protein